MQWCGLVAAASCRLVAACVLFVCKLVLRLLVAAALSCSSNLAALSCSNLAAFSCGNLAALKLQQPCGCWLQQPWASLFVACLRLFVCRACVGLVVDCF